MIYFPIKKILNWDLFFLLLFIIVLGIYLIVMPRFNDDYWYILNLSSWLRQQGPYDPDGCADFINFPFPWDGIIQTWKEHYDLDNIRFGNVLVVIFLLLPKWVGSSLALISWIYAMFLSFKIANVSIRKSPLVLFAIICWGIFVPWPSFMGSLDFQFNYVLPDGLILLLLSILFNPDNHPKFLNYNNLKKFIFFTYIFLLGLLIGIWHEAFSISIFISLALLVIFFKDFRRLHIYVALTGLLIGIIILISAPGTVYRVRNIQSLTLGYKFLRILAYNSLFFLMLLILFYRILIKKIKIINLSPHNKILLFCITSGLIPILMAFFTIPEARVTWWSQIVSVIGIMILFKENNSKFWSRYNIKNLIWLLPLFLFVFSRFTFMDVYAFKTHKIIDKAIRQFQENPDKNIYADLITNDQMPVYCMMITDVVFTSQFKCVGFFLSEWTGSRNFKILPNELCCITSHSGKKLEGNIKAREINGRVFIPGDELRNSDYMALPFEVDYGLWKKRVNGMVFSFISEVDGKEYIYLNLMTPWPERNFLTIKGVSKL